ncbi:hypothetical protein LEP1GSC050_3877 [Leptospira broomii serovar Hurstbridge str. 5399]|uniref:Uncharacterized protein n=1 Tax=Leptospira broomii serovar Hurstbridge str. 5399 TaxID=1049789 RepID=T0FC09_9LEPT|nr:hypothetical protein LEP1GSC050_3877 [Leptospira broomii serovar Hurstbridge str. 5399]
MSPEGIQIWRGKSILQQDYLVFITFHPIIFYNHDTRFKVDP